LQPVHRNPVIAAAGRQVEQQYGWSLEDNTSADGELVYVIFTWALYGL
jgi:hypothetical protein